MNYISRHVMHLADSDSKLQQITPTLSQTYYLLKANTNTDFIFTSLEILPVIFISSVHIFQKITKAGSLSTVENNFQNHHRIFASRVAAEEYAKILKKICIEKVESSIEYKKKSIEKMQVLKP